MHTAVSKWALLLNSIALRNRVLTDDCKIVNHISYRGKDRSKSIVTLTFKKKRNMHFEISEIFLLLLRQHLKKIKRCSQRALKTTNKLLSPQTLKRQENTTTIE